MGEEPKLEPRPHVTCGRVHLSLFTYTPMSGRPRRKRKRSWVKKQPDAAMRMKVLESMRKMASQNNGLIPLLKPDSARPSAILKKGPMGVMILDNLVEVRGKKKREIVALDCEMVGVGTTNQSALGRCSIINYDGDVIYDSYIRPSNPITDYRTLWSGITPRHMERAKPFVTATREIQTIIAEKIVIGHDLRHDFSALNFTHPQPLIRDTSSLQVLLLPHVPSLRLLAKVLLDCDIQMGKHCSIEDSRTCLSIYKLFENSWENRLTHVNYNDCFDTANEPSTTTTTTVAHCNTPTEDVRDKPQSSDIHNFLSLSEGPSSSQSTTSRVAVKSTVTSSASTCPPLPESTRDIVAIHCDLVTLCTGHKHVGRCVILDGDGHVLLKTNIRPEEDVKEYCFKSTGLKARHLDSVRSTVSAEYPRILRTISGKTVVGHGLSQQLKPILDHCRAPGVKYVCRDTAESVFVRRKAKLDQKSVPSLNALSRHLLSEDMEQGALRKARTVLNIYKALKPQWEPSLMLEYPCVI